MKEKVLVGLIYHLFDLSSVPLFLEFILQSITMKT